MAVKKINLKDRFEMDLFYGKHTKSNHYTTLILGPNGCGKSRLLMNIAEGLRKNEKYVEHDFESIDQLTVLAISTSPHDKFIFNDRQNDSNYKYFGPRTSSNSIYPSNYFKDLYQQLYDLYISEKMDLLNAVLSELGISDNIYIKYKIKPYIDLRNEHGNVTKSDLIKYIDDKVNEINTSDVKRVKLKKTEINVDHIHKLLNSKQLKDQIKYTSATLSFSFMNKYEITPPLQRQLNQLGLFKDPSVLVAKDVDNNNILDLDELSSGEINFLVNFLFIANNITENSVILIDEPEISLHPTWQMKYFLYLKNLLESNVYKNYNIHTIVASHSHFLVSSLEKENSTVIKLVNKDGTINGDHIEYSTFAKSAENVLYHVFGVATTRNFYFEEKLREIAHFISNNNKYTTRNQIEKIQLKIQNLRKYIDNDEDPLKILLDKADSILTLNINELEARGMEKGE